MRVVYDRVLGYMWFVKQEKSWMHGSAEAVYAPSFLHVTYLNDDAIGKVYICNKIKNYSIIHL